LISRHTDGDCLLTKSDGVSSLKLFSFAGVVIFRRSFRLRTNVFVSNGFSFVNVGVKGSEINIKR